MHITSARNQYIRTSTGLFEFSEKTKNIHFHVNGFIVYYREGQQEGGGPQAVQDWEECSGAQQEDAKGRQKECKK